MKRLLIFAFVSVTYLFGTDTREKALFRRIDSFITAMEDKGINYLPHISKLYPGTCLTEIEFAPSKEALVKTLKIVSLQKIDKVESMFNLSREVSVNVYEMLIEMIVIVLSNDI